MSEKSIVLAHNDDATAAGLNNRTFQVHVVAPGVLKLYPVTILPTDNRCPCIIAGEQCGMIAGHEGKHRWSSGD